MFVKLITSAKQCITRYIKLFKCVEQRIAGNGNRSSASLQISRILWNTTIYNAVYIYIYIYIYIYNTVYIIPLPVIILSEDQSSPCPPSHFLYIHLIIIFPSMLMSPKWSLSHMSSHQIPVCTSPVIHTCHKHRPSHITCLYHPNDTVSAVQIISSPSYGFSHYLLTSTLFSFILLSNLSSKTFSLIASLTMRNRVSHSLKTTSLITFSSM
jgi:hypothetical protein